MSAFLKETVEIVKDLRRSRGLGQGGKVAGTDRLPPDSLSAEDGPALSANMSWTLSYPVISVEGWREKVA